MALLSVDDETWEKKCYLFFVTLVWARPYQCRLRLGYNYQFESQSYWKETLLKAVRSWRYGLYMNQNPLLTGLHSSPNKDAFAIMSEASLHFTYAAYKAWNSDDKFLTFYFTIFLLRFIPFICNSPAQHTCRHETQPLQNMLLSTFLHWLDSILFGFVSDAFSDLNRCTPRMLQTKIAIDGLLM